MLELNFPDNAPRPTAGAVIGSEANGVRFYASAIEHFAESFRRHLTDVIL